MVMQVIEATIQALSDWKFNKFVTPFVIRALYGLGCVLAVVMMVNYWITGFRTSDGMGVLHVFLSVFIGLFYVLILRVVLEILMVLFKGAEAWSKAGTDQDASEATEEPEVIEAVSTEVTEKKKSVTTKKQD